MTVSVLGAVCGAPKENFGASAGVGAFGAVSVAVDAPNENLGASDAVSVGLVSGAPNENAGGGFDSDEGSFVEVAPKENFGVTVSSDLESIKLIFGAVVDSNVNVFIKVFRFS